MEKIEEISIDDILSEDIKEQQGNVYDLSTLFDNEEQENDFFSRLPKTILDLWANNDRLVHFVVPVGAANTLKKRVDELTVPDMNSDLERILDDLRRTIQYSESEEENCFRVITLKQLVNLKEVLSAHSWASNPDVQLYDKLSSSGLVVQPTMEELRILLLIDTLLSIRIPQIMNEQNNKIVTTSRMPPSLR